MVRKEAVIVQAAAHLAVDSACFFLLAGKVTQTAETTLLVGTGYLIFLLISYGLRPFLGTVFDAYPKLHSQAIGCLLVGLSLLLPASWAWFALFPAGVGSALFHVGAFGESLAFARGYFSRPAAVLSTGVFGAALGTLLAGRVTDWILTLLLVLLSLGCFFFAEARKYPRRIRSFRHSITRELPRWGILVFTLLPLLILGLTRSLLPATWAKGWLALLPAASCMLGRLGGGIAADRFGPKKTVVISFCLAAVLLGVFTHIPPLYCLGLASLCAPTAVVFGTATAALPEKPHTAVGACSAVLLLGSVPGWFPSVPTVSVRILCGTLMIAGAAVSLLIYTDHRRIFHLRKLPKKGGTR